MQLFKKICILIGLFLLITSGLSYAQTIHCPQNPQQRQKMCNEKKRYVRYAEQRLAVWDRVLSHKQNYTLLPWRKMTHQQYRGLQKPRAIVVRGKQVPVFGVYRDSSTNIVYLVVSRVVYYNALIEHFNGNISRAQGEYQNGVRNGNRLMASKLPARVQRARQDLQQARLFLAQCCGRRWTNDPAPQSPTRQPNRNPNWNGRGLLGIEPPPSPR